VSLGTDQAPELLSSVIALVQGNWISPLCSKQVHEVDWKNPGEGKGRAGAGRLHPPEPLPLKDPQGVRLSCRTVVLASGAGFFMDPGWVGGWFGDDSGTLHFCALYFSYCCISSTSDHQAFNPAGWGPLLREPDAYL